MMVTGRVFTTVLFSAFDIDYDGGGGGNLYSGLVVDLC